MESKYGKITQSQFDEKTKRFKSRGKLYYFILNVLKLISYQGWYYCFCDKFNIEKKSNENNCPLCQIPLIFFDFRKDLCNNMLEEKFLWDYHSRLDLLERNIRNGQKRFRLHFRFGVPI